jgi:cation-transporting ATPase E
MSGADADGADIRPTLLAIGLVGVYALFFLLPPLREFFELVPLSWLDFVVIAALAVTWAVLVMVLWRARIVDRVRARLQTAPSG